MAANQTKTWQEVRHVLSCDRNGLDIFSLVTGLGWDMFSLVTGMV